MGEQTAMDNTVDIAVIKTRMDAYEKRQEEILERLDELVSLRNKGIGAFWLASALVGSGIVGSIALVIDWFKA